MSSNKKVFGSLATLTIGSILGAGIVGAPLPLRAEEHAAGSAVAHHVGDAEKAAAGHVAKAEHEMAEADAKAEDAADKAEEHAKDAVSGEGKCSGEHKCSGMEKE